MAARTAGPAARPRLLQRVRGDVREGALTPLTIVTYHYVRDGSRLPARSIAEFEAQLDYVARRYQCIGVNDVLDGSWPENACLLTFDDGLVDHLDTVAPALERRHLRGVFCVPGQGVVERRLLDVHMVQLLLASVPDHGMLAARTSELAAAEAVDTSSRTRTPNHRFDPPETAFVKRVLQNGLPEHRRRELLDGLFRTHVGDDGGAVADDLYLTLEDCRELVRRGHDVIGHGYAHRRLGLLDEEAQRSEIERTLEFVRSVGGTWALSYPHGSRNATTMDLLREHACLLALTTESRRATHEDLLLELPRIDTNDLQLELAGEG